MLRDVQSRESCGFGGDHCLAPSRSVDAPADGAAGRYERLFPEPLALAGEDDALLALGAAGGICDPGESCEDAIETAAGWSLFGQFIAHDITVDRSPLTHRAELSDAVKLPQSEGGPRVLDADPGSYRANDPSWTPTLPARNERFGLPDLLLATE
jgi:hypothetical protein